MVKSYCIHIITFKAHFNHVIFLFSGLFIDFRNGLIHVNSLKTSHSCEISETSRAFEAQSAQPHVFEAHE